MTGSPSRPDSKEAPPEQAKNETSPPLPPTSLSSRRKGIPPRLLLEGSDITTSTEHHTPLDTGTIDNAPDEEDAGRLRELDRLRIQLQKSELNRSPHASHRVIDSARAEHQQEDNSHEVSPEAPSPEVLKSSQRSRRRVQWVGLSADDDYRMYRSS